MAVRTAAQQPIFLYVVYLTISVPDVVDNAAEVVTARHPELFVRDLSMAEMLHGNGEDPLGQPEDARAGVHEKSDGEPRAESLVQPFQAAAILSGRGLPPP